MNDDGTNVDPVEMTELSPTRAELIAHVRVRGRQIRARRRLAVTGLTALVVLAIAAPAIAIGARSSSHGVTPATVVHRKGDFRVAPVLRSSSPPCTKGALPYNPPGAATQHPRSLCLQIGTQIMDATDVRNGSVVYDAQAGWMLDLEISRAAVARLAAQASHQVAMIVNHHVVSAPVVEPGITGTTVTISPLATRAQAIELATEILGRAPSHVDAEPQLTASIELPGDTIVAGADLKGTLVVDNATGKPIDLSRGGCHAKFAITLRNDTFTNQPLYTTDCALGPWILPTGVTRWNFTLIASYYGPRPSASRSLPVGSYEAVLVTDTPGFLPDPTPVPVRVVAAPPPPPSVGALSLQTGKRSIKLLVPAGWTFTWVDAGGSGSSSTWTNPHDPNEKIVGKTGVEVGSWWETDGVAGSINPRGFLPAGAHIDRVNRTTFLYSVDEPNGSRIDGVWIADLYQGLPYDYVSAQVELPAALHPTATTIINRFISDRKALPPSLTRP